MYSGVPISTVAIIDIVEHLYYYLIFPALNLRGKAQKFSGLLGSNYNFRMMSVLFKQGILYLGFPAKGSKRSTWLELSSKIY